MFKDKLLNIINYLMSIDGLGNQLFLANSLWYTDSHHSDTQVKGLKPWSLN